MIDTQELRDKTLEAAAARIHETIPGCRWDDAMDAARAVMEIPAIDDRLPRPRSSLGRGWCS
jgi:hypothetical protein